MTFKCEARGCKALTAPQYFVTVTQENTFQPGFSQDLPQILNASSPMEEAWTGRVSLPH